MVVSVAMYIQAGASFLSNGQSEKGKVLRQEGIISYHHFDVGVLAVVWVVAWPSDMHKACANPGRLVVSLVTWAAISRTGRPEFPPIACMSKGIYAGRTNESALSPRT
jgi:hypothetical protein